MPTDENNGVTPQNQQVDPNLAGGQSAQNPGNSDDFDFSFEDNDSNSNNGGMNSDLSGDMQDQMRRQGRSGMFLTPDEEIARSNENNDMSFGQIDLSSTVQPQTRSGMFLTPDEEGNKEEAMIEGKQYNFQGATDTQADDSEDSYLAGIDPSDVEDSQDDIVGDNQNENVQDDYSQDKLNDEIEDLISFGDEPKANNEEAPVEQEPEPQIEESASAAEEVGEQVSVAEEPVQSVDENIQEQNMQVDQVNPEDGQEDNTGSELQEQNDTNSMSDGTGENSEDRLSQEDKKVEESFGTQSENVSPDVDVSPETVGQNVENVINEPVEMVETTDTAPSNIDVSADSATQGDTVLDENIQLAENNDLHIENMGTDVVENGNGDLISDTGGMQQMEQENTYVPNEAEFNQMSDLLNSSNTGQIDLSNINSEQAPVQQVETEQTMTDSMVSSTFGADINETENPVDNTASVGQGGAFQSGLESNVDDELSKYEEVQPQLENISQDVQPNIVENDSNGEINLDSLVAESAPVVNQETVENNEVNGVANEGGQEEQVQVVPQKKKKKQSGFTVLGIFLGAILFLGLVGFAASKMFPDKFSKIFKKNDIVTEYLLGDDEENNISDEANSENIDGENPEDINEGNPEDLNEENPDDIDNPDNVGEEELDPDSLAAQLGQEDENDAGDGESDETGENEENPEGMTENNGEGDQTGDDTENGSGDTGDFDPFAEFSDILGEAQEYVEQLNAYVSSGQYYIEWGETNAKPTISTVGRKVMEMAQAELTKLENGEEMDTTAFDRMDELLKKLSDLAK